MADKKMPGYIWADERADVDTVTNYDASEQLIHFATHGDFPAKVQDKEGYRPYQNSGLLLYHKGQQPALGLLWDSKEPFLLSPERLLKAKWNIEGSHVTLQACVSGQAKEGIGGDALGLDWAFLQLGASSILSTGWNVPIEWANDFCLLFYEKWQSGLSKAHAYQQACQELRAKTAPDDLTAPYYWAGFSLTGDWR